MADDRIPVTVLSGYLGAGKTTMVNHLLANPGDRRIAVILNDMGEVNVDAELVARENDEEGVVDLSNGCICCRLQDDLLSEAAALAESREFDYLLVESSGISEPIPIARAFTEGTDDSEVDPTERFRLDTMVTVLDSYGFWKEFNAGESLPGDGEPAADRPLADVLVEGIEFCDVLVLNKTDMVPDDVLDEIESVADRLGPRAKRIRTSYSEVDPDDVLDTGRFDFETAKRSPGWKRAIAESEGEGESSGESRREGGGHAHGHDHAEGAAAAHGVDSFVYRSTDALDPEPFADWLDDWDGAIVRAKGVANVTGTDEVIGVSQAGPSVQAGPIGEWAPDDDRRTRLVFIGSEMDEAKIRGELDDLATAEVDGKTATGEEATEAFPL
ncbi:cobalamin synthesis protein P47K [Halorubrum distributum JCM 9100]|uniref:Cobalamin synthesis protein P47K n=2 Tax=Halorubrum distributum TaxID=29283 RepID=M0F3D4_9EURY|nr:GTP-binding protein [Halorubrum distributum]ELZ53868.1 cobalamin synthesis protein P47K [Halorubrum distributum JCM 9100]ELZ56013.1 cobalamin synthesis protein P47K [Halorubrum distributum JCM 10118]